ncbi:MAG: universal stress protein [Wenzhouxiangella sp.]
MDFKYTSLLIAFDDSASAARALAYGLDLAERLKLPVRVIHVASSPASGRGDYGRVDLKAIHEAAGDPPEYLLGAALLERALAQANRRRLNIEAVLLSGDPADALLRYAADCDRPILLLGRRGRGLLREILLGSVSDTTLRLAKCPVMVVH